MTPENYTEVTGSDSEIQFIKPAELTELEGTFVAAETGKFGLNYRIQKEDGSIAVVNGCGSLDKKMPNVEPGSLVKLVNAGRREITQGPNKGKSFHDIKVLVANA